MATHSSILAGRIKDKPDWRGPPRQLPAVPVLTSAWRVLPPGPASRGLAGGPGPLTFLDSGFKPLFPEYHEYNRLIDKENFFSLPTAFITWFCKWGFLDSFHLDLT